MANRRRFVPAGGRVAGVLTTAFLTAGFLLVAPAPAQAFQDSLGGFGAFLPVVAVFALAVIVFAIWNHRTRDAGRRGRRKKRRR